MRRAIHWGAVALLGTALIAGCGKKDDEKKKEGAKRDEAVAKGAEAAKKIKGVNELVEKGKNLKAAFGKKEGTLTVEQYEKYMLGLSQCAIKDRDIDYKCPQFKEFQEARRKMRTPREARALSKKHLAHPHPAVRLHATKMMSSFLGASAESQQLVLDAVGKEKHPAVVTAMVRVVGSKAGVNPKVAELLFAMTEHESPLVRMEAVSWLTTSFSKNVKGSVDKVIGVIEKDKDPKVRQHACKNVGKRGDEKALGVLKKHTTDKAAAADSKMYAACMRGLMELWDNYPFYDHASKKAFDIFTQRLLTKKCNKEVPPWSLMSSIGRHAKDDKFQKAAPWFAGKKNQLLKALGKVATCKEANWMARTGAIKSMTELGADKAMFTQLLAAYRGQEKNFDHTHVIKALQDAAK